MRRRPSGLQIERRLVPSEPHRRSLDTTSPAIRQRAARVPAWIGPALSFVWPGLGQLAFGARRRGVLFAAIQLVVLLVALVAWIAGSMALIGWLVNPQVLAGLLALNGVLLLARLFSIADTYRIRARVVARRSSAATLAIVGLLLGVSVLGHGAAAYVGWTAYDTLTTVFSPTGPRGAAFQGMPSSSASSLSGGVVALDRPSPRITPSGLRTPRAIPTATPSATLTPSPTPSPTPEPTPESTPVPNWAADGRLNVLLVGSDAGPGRWKLRTDAMILVTIEVETGRAAFFGIPRNMLNVPLPPPMDAIYPNGFPEMINALWVHADAHPEHYPGGETRAFDAVQGAVGALAGVEVDGMAVVDLNGFVRLVDALGGLDISVPEPLYDSWYPNPDNSGTVELWIPAGPQHMDGWHALAYARSRHQDSDYGRMARQQTVLAALRHKLSCDLLARLPEVLGVVRDNVWTNLPLDELPSLLDVARRIDADAIQRFTLTPPEYPTALDAAAIERIRATVRDVFAAAPPIEGSPDPAPAC
ncbi:MAG: LCP family protein [Candidatus Limnocylindria bacterium]